MKYLTVFLLFLFLAPMKGVGQVDPSGIDGTLLKESVKAVLGVVAEIDWGTIPVRPALKRSLEGKLKSRGFLPDTLYVGTVETDDGRIKVVPDIAPSKSELFSYVLYLDGHNSIIDVDVLEYRENYGYEIDYPFFRKQYHGKRSPEEVLFGRTIQNISGATISARSLTNSVHDLLALIQAMK